MRQSDQNDLALPFILGAVVDFMLHLCESDQPIIVGKDYPNDKVVDIMADWCDNRNMKSTTFSRDLWLKACQEGRFNG